MKKSLIIKLLIMILIFTIIVIIILIKLNKKEEFERIVETENPPLTIVADIIEQKDEVTFKMINNCIEKYYIAIENKKSEEVYNLLDSQYIKNKDIKVSNIVENIDILQSGFEAFRTKKVYSIELETDKCQYYVLGEILGKNYATIQDTYIIISVDYENKVFSILPTKISNVDLAKYESIIDNIQKENKEFPKIVGNEDNELISVTMKTEDIIDFYLKDYLMMAVYYPEIGYNLLVPEYREAKFESLEEYREFINQNIFKLENSVVTSYRFDDKENYAQYTIIDNYDNTYVFKVYSAMNYKVIPDLYTLNLESVSQLYDESDEQEKVAINIQKIVSALNSKDYEYVYSKLSRGFKEEKYPTIESLKTDFEDKLFGTFTVKFNQFNVEGNTYIYDIKLEGRTVSSSSLDMQIIMQLLDNQNFVMSFNIKGVI